MHGKQINTIISLFKIQKTKLESMGVIKFEYARYWNRHARYEV